MKLEEYIEIVNTIKNYKGLTRDCAKMLASKYTSYPRVTLYAILSLEVQNNMRRNFHHQVFGKNTNLYASYLKDLKKQELSQNKTSLLLGYAVKLRVPPALLAREVLMEYCELEDTESTKQDIKNLLKDTSLIKDRNLAYDVYMCILYDDQYGPISNAIDESVGEEYELKLEYYLKEHKIPFYNENDLRAKGYDKTPDYKLEIPIAVDGFVVNWIESKAQFGSPTNHNKYIQEQFLSYWNRFGPGLVIYWFGYVDTIIASNESRFIVMDNFPENIIYMNPNIVKE